MQFFMFAVLVVGAYGCGSPTVPPSVSRVVGGAEAEPHSWPWQVSVQYQMGGQWFSSCGGTLISENWVLTAAHCMMSYQYRVLLGKHNLREEEEGSFTIRIAALAIHPDYDDHLTRNDIALLKLETPVTFSDSIMPACLPDAGFVLPHDEPCYVTGWGRLYTEGSGSDTLQQALLPVVEYAICRQPDWWSFLVTEKMVCAGGDGVVGSCMGDSGGPLNCQNADGAWEVHGIVSFGSGSGCNYPKRPSVFTRVSAYRPWIDRYLAMYP